MSYRWSHVVENVAPHPHAELALGFSNTNREPIMSSFQSICVPKRWSMEILQVYSCTFLNTCVSTLDGFSTTGSSTYSKPLQPPDLHENNN